MTATRSAASAAAASQSNRNANANQNNPTQPITNPATNVFGGIGGGGIGGGGGAGGGGGGGGAGGGPPAPPAAPAPAIPAPVVFALVPAQAQQNVIDYASREGMALYRQATASLYSGTEAFDCESDQLDNLVTLVGDRVAQMGYNQLMTVIDRSDPAAPVQRNFMDNFGDFTLDDVIATARTYIQTPTRIAQESAQLYFCLRNSLSEAGLARMAVHETTYTVNGIPSGIVFLKVLIAESDVDTHATASHIRMQLQELDQYMESVSSDIIKFNLHVKTLLKALSRRRQVTHDILTNLFKGYKAASDKPFVEYIERKQEEHEEGIDLNHNTLMTMAVNKYKIRLRRQEWSKPSENETKLLALQSEIKLLKKRGARTPTKSTNPSDDKEKDRRRKDKEASAPRPAWMKVQPTAEEKGKSKTVGGKDYWWCEPRKVWARHHPDECNAAKQMKDAAKKILKLRKVKAMESVMEDYGSDDDEQSSDDEQE